MAPRGRFTFMPSPLIVLSLIEAETLLGESWCSVRAIGLREE